MNLKKEGVLPLDFALQLKNGVIAKKQPGIAGGDMQTESGAKGAKVSFSSPKKVKNKDVFLTVVEDPEGRKQTAFPLFRFAPSKALLK